MGRFMLSVCIMCGKCEKEWNSKEFKHQDFCPSCVKKYKLRLKEYFYGKDITKKHAK